MAGYTMFKDGATNWAQISQGMEGPCAVQLDASTIRLFADGLEGSTGIGLRYQDLNLDFTPKGANTMHNVSINDGLTRHATVVDLNKYPELSVQP